MEPNPSGLNTIDQLARTDPLWQKLLDQEAHSPSKAVLLNDLER